MKSTDKIVKIINGNNLVDLVQYFNDVIEIGDTDLRITRQELLETLEDWFALGNTHFPEHSVLPINDNILKITLSNVPETFFLPLNSNIFYVIFSDNVIVGFSENE